MGSALLALAFLAGALWYWRHSSHQHEHAIATVRLLLYGKPIQLLDDTVALARTRLARDPQGRVVFVRTYVFEVSLDGYSRLRGSLTLTGDGAQIVDLPWLDWDPDQVH
ncbi:MAG: DUF3301 domain-containing protein [Gammaproteobacteria bacterium]|nr:DUF3301 domain-containing protein [Gammaproteobacteria bacterium]